MSSKIHEIALFKSAIYVFSKDKKKKTQMKSSSYREFTYKEQDLYDLYFSFFSPQSVDTIQ